MLVNRTTVCISLVGNSIPRQGYIDLSSLCIAALEDTLHRLSTPKVKKYNCTCALCMYNVYFTIVHYDRLILTYDNTRYDNTRLTQFVELSALTVFTQTVVIGDWRCALGWPRLKLLTARGT